MASDIPPLMAAAEATRPPLASLPVNAPPPSLDPSGKPKIVQAPPNPSPQLKRTLEEYGVHLDDDDEQAHSSSDDLVGEPMDKNCNQVRNMIRNFIDSGDMKIGQFCDTIGVSGHSYRTFMGQNGPHKGEGSDTFMNAWAFFKKREKKGVPPPRKKSKATASKGKDGGQDGEKKGRGKKAASAHPDISGITLPGEDSDSVPIHETCDEVRKKINAYLRKDSVTAASFCRELHAQYHTPAKKPTAIRSTQLSTFRSKKGPKNGNTSTVFYAAYVLFEKLRVLEGKPKSKHRKEMEEAWPTGFDTEPDHGV